MDKARQAAEQATDEARGRTESAATVLRDPDATQRNLDAAGQPAKRGLGVVRKGVSTAIDRIDDAVEKLADVSIESSELVMLPGATDDPVLALDGSEVEPETQIPD
jgi:hypothetical protein